MIKLSHATFGAIVPILLLTWYFSGLMDEYHIKQTMCYLENNIEKYVYVIL